MIRMLSIMMLAMLGGTTALADPALRIDPPAVTLTGPQSRQQLRLFQVVDGRATADLTAEAKFQVHPPGIVTISAEAEIRAVSDGQATITASHGEQTARMTVRVQQTTTATPPSFRHQVLPTLTRTGCNSGACHGALAGKGGFKLSLRGYDPESDHFALTRQALARRIDRASPENSLLLQKATRTIRHAGGTRFDEDSDHYRLLHDWIASGAHGPSDSDPMLERIDIFPATARLAPKQTLSLIVRATYSNGIQEDVTRWAKFTSSDEQVAKVDEDGRVTVAGFGEAGIAALFGTQIARAIVTSPFPNQVAAADFEKSPRNNFIDDFVLEKLRMLNLPPSPPCSDAEFIRRAFLDTCGILPTPAEVTAFVEDRSPEKRAKLIDQLLERPEYVDYWSHKWSDLFLVSSRKLPVPAMWAYYQAIRQAVADNQPWDEFARNILTASGSNLQNGAANYFVLHKDLTDLTESTAVTFLGLSINCARCHNHPLEKWTQDQYWAFANLFSRVTLKDTGRAGEVVVRSLPSGDALHLRRGIPMPPAPLDGTPLPLNSSTDRRQHLAAWLTSPANPYFARAIINRVWRNFLGRGLVEAEDDLRDTNPPTHPELLAKLAEDFIAHRYDMKHLIRQILNSATYQRSSRPLPANQADDRFYSRYLLRRLNAEVLLDAYSEVTAVPTPFDTIALGASAGTRNETSYPLGVRAQQLPDSQLISRFLDAFGRAERVQTCSCERSSEATVAQTLHLSNGETLNMKLRDPKSRLSRWLAEKRSDSEMLNELFLRALGRAPTISERDRFLASIAQATQQAGDIGRREAWEDAFWAILTGKEFLFNH